MGGKNATASPTVVFWGLGEGDTQDSFERYLINAFHDNECDRDVKVASQKFLGRVYFFMENRFQRPRCKKRGNFCVAVVFIAR